MPDSSVMIIRGKCPACGETHDNVLADLGFGAPPISTYLQEFYRANSRCDFSPLKNERFRLMDCTTCGCIYQNPVPTDAFLARFYGQGLYGTPALESVPVQPYQVEQNLRELMMIVRYFQPRIPRPSVLDFGTGHGQWATLAAAAGLDAHACDLSEHAFSRLESSGVSCHRTDDLPATRFDFINTEQVFEHLPQPADDLRRIIRAMRPGGVLKIGVPYDARLRDKLRHPDWLAAKNSPASLNAVAPVEHLNHFEPASLQALAKRMGLLPLVVSGWNLLPREVAAKRGGLRTQLSGWLRTRLGDFYRPYWALTQTAFFLKPSL